MAVTLAKAPKKAVWKFPKKNYAKRVKKLPKHYFAMFHELNCVCIPMKILWRNGSVEGGNEMNCNFLILQGICWGVGEC
jgi:DNA-binding ferritin-like protein (Dps family)